MERQEDRHDRTRSLLPDQAMDRLAASRVLVAGLGGVGSWAVEALARAGIGQLVLVDFDRITPSNLNRQLYALESTLGQAKCDLAQARIADINPAIRVQAIQKRLEAGAIAGFLEEMGPLDYIVDAIDSLDAKADLLVQAVKGGIPVIASMGMGNRLDPSALCLSDLSKTHTDPLAKRLRQALRPCDLTKIQVVFSKERPLRPRAGRGVIGSMPYLPPLAGFLMASQVIRDLGLTSVGLDPLAGQTDGGKEQEGSQIDQDNDRA